jgi:hypothetical protein
MESLTFKQRMSQVDSRIRELDCSLSGMVAFKLGPVDTASWYHERFLATVVLHRTESPPRLSLSLHTGRPLHPDAVQIGFYDADVVELIARPTAALFSNAAA